MSHAAFEPQKCLGKKESETSSTHLAEKALDCNRLVHSGDLDIVNWIRSRKHQLARSLSSVTGHNPLKSFYSNRNLPNNPPSHTRSHHPPPEAAFPLLNLLDLPSLLVELPLPLQARIRVLGAGGAGSAHLGDFGLGVACGLGTRGCQFRRPAPFGPDVWECSTRSACRGAPGFGVMCCCWAYCGAVMLVMSVAWFRDGDAE